MQKGVDLVVFDSILKDKVSGFCTTINGGVSQGAYATFNQGIYNGDDIDAVAENRERLAQMLEIPEECIIVPRQTHEDKIAIIDEAFLNKSDLEKVHLLNGIDALITNQKGICIGIITADCVPVLIYDSVNNIIATVHAGWKGTVLRIAAKTVQKMIDSFGCTPENLLVGIGPCISQNHFEVGEEVVDAFIQAGYPMETIGVRNANTGKMHLDLPLANKISLTEVGILSSNIELSGLCTYSNPDRFFSARRQGINSGRMLTGGLLK